MVAVTSRAASQGFWSAAWFSVSAGCRAALYVELQKLAALTQAVKIWDWTSAVWCKVSTGCTPEARSISLVPPAGRWFTRDALAAAAVFSLPRAPGAGAEALDGRASATLHGRQRETVSCARQGR